MNREKKEKEVEKGVDENAKEIFEEPGQHERELNPYWKEGGTGLPEEEPHKKKKVAPVSVDIAAGDGGAEWWQRAYQRCVEQSKEQGKTLEEVAADRYGSLKNLEAMVSAATKNEKKLKKSVGHSNYRQYDKRYSSSRSYDDCNRERIHNRFRRPDVDEELDDSQNRISDNQGSHHRWKKRNHLEPNQESASTSEHLERKRRFLRPEDDADRYLNMKPRYGERSSIPHWKKEQFTKSGEGNNRNSGRETIQDRDQEHSKETESLGHKRRGEGHNLDRMNRKGRGNEPGKEKYRSNREKEKYTSEMKKEDEPPSTSDSPSSEDTSSSSPSESEAESESSNIIDSLPKILTEQELNELGAKMVKAELIGNNELAAEIKSQIEQARKARELYSKSHPPSNKTEIPMAKNSEEVLLTLTDRYGNVRPLPGRDHTESGGQRRKQKIKTHSQGGSRERYFHDDDDKDLKSLVEQEKLGTAEDSNRQFIKLAGKAFGARQGLEDMDEVFMEEASKKTSEAKIELKERSQAIAEHRKISAAMDRCQFCFEKVQKHLIIAIGLKVYLCLPNHRSMTEGHCLIVPMQHLMQSTGIDEDVFEEIQVFRRALTKMYQMHDLDCVFMETCKDLHRHPHLVIECVPLPKELGDMAPIYFKKAIQESESEWSHNKKVVDLSKKNIRNAVPKGFPYFAVNFGLQGGFAHVIEEERSFPYYFGREILGGMLDLEPALWRKPHKESFEEQRRKVLAFAEWWKPVDWTQKLKAAIDSE